MWFGPRMSQSPDEKSVYLTYEKSIYKLNCQSANRPNQCTWDKLNQVLQTSRQMHIQPSVQVTPGVDCEI